MTYQVPDHAGKGYVTVTPTLAKVVVEAVVLDELVVSDVLSSDCASEMLSDGPCDRWLLGDAEDAAHHGAAVSCISHIKGSAGVSKNSR
jgi:hypothetical protein